MSLQEDLLRGNVYPIMKCLKDSNLNLDEIEKLYIILWESNPTNIKSLYELCNYYRLTGNYKKGYYYAKQCVSIIGNVDYKILIEYLICGYHLKRYEESFNIGNLLLSMNLPDDDRKKIEKYRDFNIEYLLDDNIIYPLNRINKIQKDQTEKNIIFTITTCKRYDLFHKTINSFINCCNDYLKINKWLCVDDNSSDEDRKRMITMYPFFEFIFKTPEQKGHVESMNIIFDKISEYKYQLHMEDDWLFFEKRNYIDESTTILENYPQYGQCLFNVNYAQKARCRDIAGGIVKYHNNIRYLEHEYYSDKKEYNAFISRNIGKSTQAYWPHYSLRPSLLRVSTLKEIGNYKNETGHFEMDYAKRYSSLGYKSAFLDTICSYHIGKCTWEKGDNSYSLNGVQQFSKNTTQIKNTEKNLENNNSKEDDVWIITNGLDSFGHDLKYIKPDSIELLKKEALSNPNCIGFNSVGYLKSTILPPDNWIDVSDKFENFKMYIHKKRYELISNQKLDITFTITTCKRLKHFLITMSDFLNKCTDHELIKEWICVDDNSDEEDIKVMKDKYPFFKFITKNPSNKGHAKSMNILLDVVQTKYVLQYEDDWKLESKIKIKDLYDFMEKNNNTIQTKLLNEYETSVYINSPNIFTPVKKYNPLDKNELSLPLHDELLQLAKIYDHEIYDKLNKKIYVNGPYWWPGFTLNPSIYNLELMKKVGPFEIKKEFEYLHGVKIYYMGYDVYVFTRSRCLHIGNDVSAYDLNNEHRY